MSSNTCSGRAQFAEWPSEIRTMVYEYLCTLPVDDPLWMPPPRSTNWILEIRRRICAADQQEALELWRNSNIWVSLYVAHDKSGSLIITRLRKLSLPRASSAFVDASKAGSTLVIDIEEDEEDDNSAAITTTRVDFAFHPRILIEVFFVIRGIIIGPPKITYRGHKYFENVPIRLTELGYCFWPMPPHSAQSSLGRLDLSRRSDIPRTEHCSSDLRLALVGMPLAQESLACDRSAIALSLYYTVTEHLIQRFKDHFIRLSAVESVEWYNACLETLATAAINYCVLTLQRTRHGASAGLSPTNRLRWLGNIAICLRKNGVINPTMSDVDRAAAYHLLATAHLEQIDLLQTILPSGTPKYDRHVHDLLKHAAKNLYIASAITKSTSYLAQLEQVEERLPGEYHVCDNTTLMDYIGNEGDTTGEERWVRRWSLNAKAGLSPERFLARPQNDQACGWTRLTL